MQGHLGARVEAQQSATGQPREQLCGSGMGWPEAVSAQLVGASGHQARKLLCEVLRSGCHECAAQHGLCTRE
jgi:hypothetical protein